MLSIENLQEFTDTYQTSLGNVVREYCQHLFLSYLYQQPGSERLLFKGGTALRIVFRSPRFSEDLDFTGVNIIHHEIEDIFGNTLANVEKTGILVELEESKKTTGGFLGIASFHAYDQKIEIKIEISLRQGKASEGVRAVVQSDYLPPYSLVHLPTEVLIQGKLDALFARQKSRDFYDYFYLLSGNYPIVKGKEHLTHTLELLRASQINFRKELREFLPKSHAMHLRDFKKVLGDKIKTYIG